MSSVKLDNWNNAILPLDVSLCSSRNSGFFKFFTNVFLDVIRKFFEFGLIRNYGRFERHWALTSFAVEVREET
jgi:hypothetical protein